MFDSTLTGTALCAMRRVSSAVALPQVQPFTKNSFNVTFEVEFEGQMETGLLFPLKSLSIYKPSSSSTIWINATPFKKFWWNSRRRRKNPMRKTMIRISAIIHQADWSRLNPKLNLLVLNFSSNHWKPGKTGPF